METVSIPSIREGLGRVGSGGKAVVIDAQSVGVKSASWEGLDRSIIRARESGSWSALATRRDSTEVPLGSSHGGRAAASIEVCKALRLLGRGGGEIEGVFFRRGRLGLWLTLMLIEPFRSPPIMLPIPT